MFRHVFYSGIAAYDVQPDFDSKVGSLFSFITIFCHKVKAKAKNTDGGAKSFAKGNLLCRRGAVTVAFYIHRSLKLTKKAKIVNLLFWETGKCFGTKNSYEAIKSFIESSH